MELWKTPVLQLSWQNRLQLLPSLQEVAQLLAACRLSLAALGWLAPHLDPLVAPPHNLAVAQLVLPAAVAADSLLELLPPSLVLYVAEVCTAVGRTALAVGTVVVAVGTAVATASDIAVVVDIPPAVVVVHNLAAPVPELLPAHVVVVEAVAVVVAVAPPLSFVQLAAHAPAWVDQQPSPLLQPR